MTCDSAKGGIQLLQESYVSANILNPAESVWSFSRSAGGLAVAGRLCHGQQVRELATISPGRDKVKLMDSAVGFLNWTHE